MSQDIDKMIERENIQKMQSKYRIEKPNINKNMVEKIISFESVFNEIPSRTIILGNLPKEITETEIKSIINEFGEYELVDFKNFKIGRVIVRFYDLLDSMMMRCSSIYYEYKRIMVSFGQNIPVKNKKNPPNNGTIVVFNLPQNIIDSDVFSLFNNFGLIRDIRKTPNKNNQRFVEFYDSRAAMNAKKYMKKRKLFLYGIYFSLNIEFSLPGNYRANYEKFFNHNIPTIEKRTIGKYQELFSMKSN